MLDEMTQRTLCYIMYIILFSLMNALVYVDKSRAFIWGKKLHQLRFSKRLMTFFSHFNLLCVVVVDKIPSWDFRLIWHLIQLMTDHNLIQYLVLRRGLMIAEFGQFGVLLPKAPKVQLDLNFRAKIIPGHLLQKRRETF